jgi:hypothetical protein
MGCISASSVLAAALAFIAVGVADAKSRGGLPNLNVREGCRHASAQPLEGCLTDEDVARKMLVKAWQTFKAKDKAQCIQETRTDTALWSYVVLLTCLQISADTSKVSGDINK